MSNKRIDALLVEEFDGSYKSLHVFGRITYVVIEIKGFTGIGYAVCSEKDEYRLETGIEVATRRAVKHIAEQMDELGVDCIRPSDVDTFIYYHLPHSGGETTITADKAKLRHTEWWTGTQWDDSTSATD